MPSFHVRLLFGICAALGSVLTMSAADAAKGEGTSAGQPAAGTKEAPPAAKAAPAATAVTDPEILNLPKIAVTASRLKELDRAIKKLDKAISREKKKMKASDLDKVLNNPKLTQAAALFGGNSAEYMEAVAASRVRYMEAERDLLSDMREPRTLEDLAIIQKELDEIHTMQRELDFNTTKH